VFQFVLQFAVQCVLLWVLQCALQYVLQCVLQYVLQRGRSTWALCAAQCAHTLYTLRHTWPSVLATHMQHILQHICNTYVTHMQHILQHTPYTLRHTCRSVLCCSVLHCAAVCCSVLQCVALRHTCRSVLAQCVTLCYGVATISTLLKIIGLFCKRALQKRLYSAKETYNFKEPTNRSHPIPWRSESQCVVRYVSHCVLRCVL